MNLMILNYILESSGNMSKLIKNNYKFIILFFVYLVWFLIIQPIDCDEIWNYGFSVSMADGYLPYKDFNMVITPLFNFLISLPFHIFGKSILVFHIEGAIIFIITIYFLFKLIGDKSWLILAVLFGTLAEFFPNYNFFCYTLLIIIIYLEKNNKSDYLIGFLIGIMILSKQTIGCFMLIPCIFNVIKDKKRLFERITSICILVLMFIVYLLITNSISYFFNLCIFGLFDFGKNCSNYDLFILFISILIISILICLKNKNNKTNYYILMFYVVSIPIFDLNHITFMIIAFIFLLFDNIKVNDRVIHIIKYCSISLISLVFILMFLNITKFDIKSYPNKVKHFEYKYIKKDQLDTIDKINRKIKEYGIDNILFIGYSETYMLKIQNNRKIEYIDMLNKGNWGYNGNDKVKKYINDNKDKIYFVDVNYYYENTQIMKDVIRYVIKNGKKIDSVSSYDIYVFE